jgi:hypothetical protein
MTSESRLDIHPLTLSLSEVGPLNYFLPPQKLEPKIRASGRQVEDGTVVCESIAKIKIKRAPPTHRINLMTPRTLRSQCLYLPSDF